MGGRIPENVVREVLARTSISSVIGEYVRLQSRGDRHVGLCPFHQEKTPSFHVTESRGFYHCFGCKAGGDAARFLMEHDGLAFPEAIRKLAERIGMEVEEEEGGDPTEHRAERERRRLYDRAMEGAQRYWEHMLWASAGAPARAYLAERGVDEETARRFGLGYATASWTGLVDVALPKVPMEALERAGLARRGNNGPFDLFRDRIVFPIRSVSRKVVAFSGRALGSDAKAKYYNSPETEYFRKGRELFGLSVAHAAIRRRGEVVVVEGNFDVVSLHALGFDHVVAPLGTAMTPEQVRLLRRFADRVVLMFDGDRAGRTAARRALDVLLAGGVTDVALVRLEDGEDPDSVARAGGAEAVAARLAGARPMLDVCVDGFVGRAVEDGSPVARTRAARQIAALLRPVGDASIRDQYVDSAARRLGVRPEAFTVAEAEPARAPEAVQNQDEELPLRLSAEERVLVEVLSREEELLASVARDQIGGLVPTERFGVFLEETSEACVEGGTGFVDAVRGLPGGALQTALLQVIVAEAAVPAEALRATYDEVVGRLKKSWAEREMRRLVEELRQAGDETREPIRLRLAEVNRLYREVVQALQTAAS